MRVGSGEVFPVGYMAKFIASAPERLTERVTDIYSFSPHGSKNFESFIDDWQEGEVEPNNAYRLYDSPQLIRQLAGTHHVDLSDSVLFFYEVYEQEYHEDGAHWYPFDPPVPTLGIVAPSVKRLEGYDVVAVEARMPNCSLVCLLALPAIAVETNEHCLLPSLEGACQLLSEGQFDDTEPGPFQIFAVYSVDWP
jgi:hypothetical protein